MAEIYGLPQSLTGAETVTIQQSQNGQIVTCTLSLSQLASIFTGNSSGTWPTNLPTTRPLTPGVIWDNGGTVSIS